MILYPQPGPDNNRGTSLRSRPREIVSEHDLLAHGIGPDSLRYRAWWAVQYTGLDGRPVWLAEELEEMLP